MSQWNSVSALPAASANLGVVAFKHWLFSVGGATELTVPATFSGVLRANVESDGGTIGPWVPAAAANTSVALPDNKFGPAVEFVAPRTIVVAGGAPVASGSLAPTGALLGGGAEVMTSQIDGDGNLSPWLVQCTLPINVVSAALLLCQGWLFLVGGQQLQVSLPYDTLAVSTFQAGEVVTGGTSGAKLVLNAAAAGASGTLTGFVLTGGPFQEDEVLTGGTSGATASVTGAQGGSVTYVTNQNIYKARMNGDRSIFGPWQIVGQLPASVIGLTANNVCVWRNEFLYLFDQATLWKVRVNRDGDFVSVNLPASFGGNGWLPFGGPPTAFATLQQHMMAVINQNELLLAGGQDGSNASKFGVFSTHLDGDGNPGLWVETMCLPNLLLTTPAVPALVATHNVASGTLLHATTYYYRVSALNDVGETLASTETSVLTGGGADNYQVALTWAPVNGATKYNVYGRTTGAEQLIATVTGDIVTYADLGTIAPSGALPGANTTGGGTDSAGIVVAGNGGGDSDDLGVTNLVFIVGGARNGVATSAVLAARFGASGRIGGV